MQRFPTVKALMDHLPDGAFDLHQPEVVKGNLRLRSTYLISAFAEAALCSMMERYSGFKIGTDGTRTSISSVAEKFARCVP